MLEQTQEEMFPRAKKNDPQVPPSWIKVRYVVGLFAITLITTIYFNGF